MLSNFRLKIGICFLLIISSVLSACETSQDEGISSESNNPKKTETHSRKKILDSEDPVYEETGGLYTEEDIENVNHRKCQHKM